MWSRAEAKPVVAALPYRYRTAVCNLLLKLGVVLIMSWGCRSESTRDAGRASPTPSVSTAHATQADGLVAAPETTAETHSSGTVPAATEAPGAPPSPIPERNPSAPAPPTPKTLWEANADLDGDGTPEEIRLISAEVRTEGSERADEAASIPVRGCRDATPSCPAVLHVDRVEFTLQLTPRYFGGIDLSIIDIDAKDGRQELLLRERAPGHTDPPFIFQVGIYDGTALHWSELDVGGGYDSGTLDTPGNGTVVTKYDACAAITVTTYRLAGTKLRRVKAQTRKGRDPNLCAACPYVYVDSGNGFVKQGEILRNLSSRELNAKQALPLELPPSALRDGVLHVQLREEKRETTYLDSIWLEADGVDYAPTSCANEAYCATDGNFFQLSHGEVLDLYFELPHAAEDVRLQAVGHYVPGE